MSLNNTSFLTTKELAQLLRLGERKIYDLAANGDIPCVRAVGKLLFPKDEIFAWLNDTRSGPLMKPIQNIPPIIAGSHDPLLDWALRNAGTGLAGSFDGSQDGLDRFANKDVAMCLIHIKEDDEWNTPIAKRFFQNEAVVLIEFGYRDRGIIIPKGNPLNIASLQDFKRRRIAKRQDNAASQIILNTMLKDVGLQPDILFTGQKVARSEDDLARTVKSGQAEAGFGLRAVAETHGLDFIPLMTERLDMLIWRKFWFEPQFQKLWSFLQDVEFHEHAQITTGYNLTEMGTVLFNGTT